MEDRKLPCWDRFEYDACGWSGSRHLDQILGGNVPELSAVHSIHAENSEIPRLDLAYALAMALSGFVIRTKSFPLHVARAPILQEVGNPQILRAYALDEGRLELRLPHTSPGPWCPFGMSRHC